MPRPRPCLGHQGPCPTRALTRDPSGRCDQCRSQHNITRGSSTQRGYDHQHQTQREWWKHRVATGQVNCRRCHQPIQPGTDWDLGHTDNRDPTASHPEHATCNRATATHNRRSNP